MRFEEIFQFAQSREIEGNFYCEGCGKIKDYSDDICENCLMKVLKDDDYNGEKQENFCN